VTSNENIAKENRI